MSLEQLGFDQWFVSHAAGLCPAGCDIARVVAVDRGMYRLADGEREAAAELAGRFTYLATHSMALPGVGDWVAAQFYNQGTAATIHRLLPRRSMLRRKRPGESTEHQLIAANIDTAFLVQSCQYDFNLRRLERYLVMAADGQVEPVVLLTKADLVTPEALEEIIARVRAVTSARVLAVSNVTGWGFESLEALLLPGNTCCLLGSSGVGKTTVLNRLLGQDGFATGAVSGTGEGTHTTTRRQLSILPGGGLLVDTPGMRELGLIGAEEGLREGFEGIESLAAACRFADCSHQHEPGCAVRAALEQGTLQADRLASYLKLRREAAFHEMSALEKRQKDKAFSRHVNAVKQGKQHNRR
ncbi:ribosome small subunit-dependent GTPase A [Megalodesulfovibrio paquesii]